MDRKFPRKLYKCNRCRSEQVAWWPIQGKWKLIPATLSPAEGQEKGWRNEEGSPVWCNPEVLHDTECKPGEFTPTPEKGEGGGGYEPLPKPNHDGDKQEGQGEGEGEGNEMQEGDPLKPLVDAITKKVLTKVDPRLKGAEAVAGNADDKASRALKEAEKAKTEGGRGPQVTVIEWVPSPEAEHRDMGVQHKEFPRLMFWIQMGEPIYLSGPPAAGKTQATRMAAEMLGRPFGLISLNPGTPESRLIGYMDAGGAYRPTIYRTLYEKGGVFCIDEMDNSSAAMLTTINSHTGGIGAFPDGVIERHPDFVLVATGNTAGRGGTLNHSERRAMDAATLDRFVFLDWPYDEGLEEVMVKAVISDDEKREKWLKWVREVRQFCKENHPRIVVSPRSSVKGAKAIVHGKKLKVREMLDEVLFKGIEAPTVKAILAAKPMPTF